MARALPWRYLFYSCCCPALTQWCVSTFLGQNEWERPVSASPRHSSLWSNDHWLIKLLNVKQDIKKGNGPEICQLEALQRHNWPQVFSVHKGSSLKGVDYCYCTEQERRDSPWMVSFMCVCVCEFFFLLRFFNWPWVGPQGGNLVVWPFLSFRSA